MGRRKESIVLLALPARLGDNERDALVSGTKGRCGRAGAWWSRRTRNNSSFHFSPVPAADEHETDEVGGWRGGPVGHGCLPLDWWLPVENVTCRLYSL